MDITLPTVPDGFKVVIHQQRPYEAPADGVLWSIRRVPRNKVEAFFSAISRFAEGEPGRHVTRVRGDVTLFEADMQEQADEYIGQLNARELAWKIRSGR